ncbi:ribonuclease H family protein [Enterobacter hormaechei]|uniref:ribonuclease H family protein n=1 Tax=Enterobacter hormaechei TaxID=158836 RepID=UPI0023E38CA6|nr:ribonuclease H family protein [Enterobacter hormaechei]MDF3686360.1 RNase H-like domain-containing protein [Enterobacter hormaechei]
MASFYRKFIKNFSVVCNAMIETMRGDKKEFKWTHGADKSVETLKQKVVELPVISLSNFNKVFQVVCDASDSAIGAMMSQEGKLVAFFSEKLNDSKRKYPMYDRSDANIGF